MPLPAPPFRVRRSVFASSAFLLVLCAGMIALMVWSFTAQLPRDVFALTHEQALWDKGVSAVDVAYEGRVETQSFFNSYKLTVRYTDRAGGAHEGKLEISSLGGNLDESGHGEVRYDPQNPDDFVFSKALDLSRSRWAYIAVLGVMTPLIGALFGWLAFRVIRDLSRTLACARDGQPVEVAIVEPPKRDRYGNATYKYRTVDAGPKVHDVVLKQRGPMVIGNDPARAVAVRSVSKLGAVVLLRDDGFPFDLAPDAQRAMLEAAQRGLGTPPHRGPESGSRQRA